MSRNTRTPEEPSARSGSAVSPRAFVLGVLLIPLLCFWNVYSEVVAQSTELAVMSLSIAVVFALLVLLVLNALLRRWLPHLALSRADLLFIYILQTTSVGISGVGMAQFLVVGLANVFHYASAENGWAERIHPLLRRWAFPDPAVLPGFYAGESSFWTRAHVAGWIAPIAVWTFFLVILLGVTLCLNVILRRRWVEQERLTFPLVIFPLELTRVGNGGRSFWSNRTLWTGFGIAFLLQTVAGLAFLVPAVPNLPIKPSDPRLSLTDENTGFLAPLLATTPWSAFGSLEMGFYPMAIGIAFLLPLDVSFSCWFFFFLRKAQDVLATALGFREAGAGPALARIPYSGEQALGAFLGLAVFSLWGMRGYLREVVQTALRPGDLEDDRDEPLRYRHALLGLLIGFVLLVAFAAALGLAFWLGAAFFLLYLLVVLAYTRMRAEAGLPWAFGPDMTPHQFLTGAITGPAALGTRNLVGLAQLQWMDLDYRTTIMPGQLEAMKIAGNAGMRPSRIGAALLLAAVFGALSAWASILSCYYRYGAATANVDAWRTSMGSTPWFLLDAWTEQSGATDWPRLFGVAWGIAATGLLAAGRARLFWWPFHPVGYALAGTFTLPWLWCPTLVGWGIKGLVLRYGGMGLYRRALPLFLGLILGDYVSGALWALLGIVLGQPTYRVVPI